MDVVARDALVIAVIPFSDIFRRLRIDMLSSGRQSGEQELQRLLRSLSRRDEDSIDRVGTERLALTDDVLR